MANPDRRLVAAEALRAWCGIVVPNNRLPALDRELAGASGKEGPDHGLQRFLSGEPALRERMARTVATSETSLFRHPAHFRLLAEVVERCRMAGRPCRVLSAGCSTGEEVWSAGAVIAASSGETAAGTVVGWDLLDERVSKASAGTFSRWAARNGVGGYERFFTHRSGGFEASAALRRVVSFEPMNLLAIPAGESRRFEAIFFRNVCIYWDTETTRAVVRRLVDLLEVDGVLFVGPCDPIVVPDERWVHEIVDGVRRIRARRTDDRPRPAQLIASVPPLVERPAALAPRPPAAPAPARPSPSPSPSPSSMSPDEAAKPDPGLIERVRELADRGEYTAAMALLGADRAAPTAEVFKWRGILSLNLGDTLGAIAALRSCTFLSPQDAEGRRWLAVAYETAGAGKDAGREWRNAQEVERALRLR